MLQKRKKEVSAKTDDFTLPGPYFVTAHIHKEFPLLEHYSVRNNTITYIKLLGAALSARVYCVAAAVDHMHLILGLPEDRTRSLPDVLETMKNSINQSFAQEGKPAPVVWQDWQYEHIADSKIALKQKVQYVENHPVKEYLNRP